MASMCAFASPVFVSNSSLVRRNIFLNLNAKKNVACEKRVYSSPHSVLTDVATESPIIRRSASYPPSLWPYERIQSINSNYTGEKYEARLETLKDRVRNMIYKENEKAENPLSTLNLVDDLQRLGIWYHFVDDISNVLDNVYNKYYKSPEKWNTLDLNLKALGFRLLRHNGYHITQDIFEDIKDQTGNFKGHLNEDTLGMLNLYEASFHSFEDENILDEARDFTTKYLQGSIWKISDQYLSLLTSRALDMPLHWRLPRVESKWFIEAYEKRSGMNTTVLDLAKLDFNMVQAVHQEDLKHASRWWTKTTKWDDKLSFTRDRLVENYMWALGNSYRPQFTLLRRMLTKELALVTSVDDIYDVHGTFDELEKFTDVISRWNIYAIEELPDYMKICFLGLYNSVNDMAYTTLTDTGLFILPYLQKAWEDLCKAYLVEARWYYTKYMPTLKEYLDISEVSVSVPLMLTHVCFLMNVCSTEEVIQSMDKIKNLIHYSSLLLRLPDDLGTSSDEMARGDVPKSIQCYMHETGATEEEARAHVRSLIIKVWQKLNKERAGLTTTYLKEFGECAANFGRMAQFMYHVADGHGHNIDLTEAYVLSLVLNPIEGV
uniref:Bornyl diphosphate synthase n=1 Tax=Artemisia annua TaxID=35608 RepID=A0A9E8IEG7_ARTAN|nr:bornyl diphosphate synthase [Artemisia annua]UZG94252.1 bornyl diphosphate synthase [Artemisia annua]